MKHLSNKVFQRGGGAKQAYFSAFTLAEVLITIGIIGVVAALTLPGVIENVQEKILINQLKVAYNRVNTAVQMATEEYGTIDTWGETSAERIQKFKEIMPEYLKIVKMCPKGVKGCQPDGYLGCTGKTQANSGAQTLWTSTNSMVLENGMILIFPDDDGNYDCSKNIKTYSYDVSKKEEFWLWTCFGINIDINGLKKPNRTSEDYFGFYVVQDGIVPKGTQGTDGWRWSGVLRFSSTCMARNVYNATYHDNCTAWVLQNENMDYKRCPEKLGWGADKQTSCNGK